MRQHRSNDQRANLVGRRVVVRYRLHDQDHAATDVLGTLETWQDGELRIRRSSSGSRPSSPSWSRSGSAGPAGDQREANTRAAEDEKTPEIVSVPETDLITVKAIPAHPVTRREVRDLEAAAALGWQAHDVHRIGGWLLRAANGFTRRANSCLPLDDPGRPLAEAIDDVVSWYGQRALSPMFQLPSPLAAALDQALNARGWSRSEDVLVLTATIDDVRSGSRFDQPPVRVEDRPDDAWLARYHYRGDALPPNAVAVLTDAENVGFASVDLAGQRVAIARGAVSDSPAGRRWLGITAVEVAPAVRRRGLGQHIVAGLAAWAAELDASRAYLQVEASNTGAQAAYRGLGFGDHHSYHYRQA